MALTMASNKKFSTQTIDYLERFPVDVPETMRDMELNYHQSYVDEDMRSIREFRENFNLSDLIESPDSSSSSLMMGNESYQSDDFRPLSSTLYNDDNECKHPNFSNHSLSTDDSQSNLPSSTPERNFKEIRHRYKKNCPSILMIPEEDIEDNHEKPMIHVFQCSPVHSPFPDSDDNVDLNTSFVDSDETLKSFYDTPPEEIKLVDKREQKMIQILKQYGLSHFAFIFIEEEVDLDLFLTLTDSDLKELGIKRKRDRSLLLSMIEECNKRR